LYYASNDHLMLPDQWALHIKGPPLRDGAPLY